MTPVTYKYTSTKEYHDAFPCAYRQWRADSHCNLIHGYSFSMKFYFGTDNLDARNWAADYGGLKELKGVLESQFDTHCWYHKTIQNWNCTWKCNAETLPS
jgi:6-pyruvoyltetrahydropterin/6-carboxytetrahydropterin synthase